MRLPSNASLRCNSEVHRPHPLRRAQVGVAAMKRRDNRCAQQHRFCDWKSESFTPAGRDQAVAVLDQVPHLARRERIPDNINWGVTGISSECVRHDLLDFIMRIGKSLDYQPDIVPPLKLAAERVDQYIRAFSRKAGRDVKKVKSVFTKQPTACGSCSRMWSAPMPITSIGVLTSLSWRTFWT